MNDWAAAGLGWGGNVFGSGGVVNLMQWMRVVAALGDWGGIATRVWLDGGPAACGMMG